jgi:heptosyltransferase I
MKALVVKVSALGDVVHALPVLAHLKGVAPEVSIDWVVEEPFAPLLMGHPLINTVHCIDTRFWRTVNGISAGVEGVLNTARRLRNKRYDVVLDLQGNSKSGLITWTSGAPRRYGFAAVAVREYLNLLGSNHRVAIEPEDRHVSAQLLRLARTAFPGVAATDCAGPLLPPPGAFQQVGGMLRRLHTRGCPLVVFHCGTSWTTKLWAVEAWQQLGSLAVRELGVTVLLTWGNQAELEVCRQVENAVGTGTVVWPRGDLPQLTALLAHVDVVVGGDTGPVHIAAALGTPTVSFYRVTDAQRNGPCGPQHRTLQAPLACSPCLQKRCRRDADCSRSISVTAMLNALSELLEQNSKRK